MDLQAFKGPYKILNAKFSENSRQSSEHVWSKKKRSTADEEPIEGKFRYKRRKVAITEPDEVFGVLNFVYLSPNAKFFNINSQDIMHICDAYPSTYGKDPSDPDYHWIGNHSSLFKEGELNGMPVVYMSSNYSEFHACMELQGLPGIPTIIGYEHTSYSTIIVFKKYSKDLPSSLTVHQMAEQLLQALHNIHKQGLTHGDIISEGIEWDGDKLILNGWRFAQRRGDCGIEWHEGKYDAAQPFNDLAAAGKVIREWAKLRNCTDEFECLINGLSNPNAFQRLTAMQALNVIQGKAVLKPNYIDSESLFAQLSYQQVCRLFTAQFNAELTTNRSTSDNFEECQWYTEAATDRSTTLKFGTRNGAHVFAKIKQGPVKSIAWEYFVTKMMSGKSKHFPTVITSHARSTETKEVSEFVIVMPEYHTEPKVKNLRKTFQELLSALKALRYHGLVHGDIAPQNIMWDDNDELILIDFGSSFTINYECDGPQPICRGHHDFMAPEHIITPASDVYSVGRVLLHYMVQWKQENAEFRQLIPKMICLQWYKRPTVEQLDRMWHEMSKSLIENLR